MAEEIIRLRGDTSDAQDEFADLSNQIRGTNSALEETAERGESAGNRLARLATITTGISSAMGILRGAFNLVRESTEKYLRSVEEGDQLWANLERQIREVQGKFIELVVGTDDVSQGFETISGILEDVIAIIDGLMSVVRPLVSVLRGALTGALSVVAGAARVLTGAARESESALEGMGEEAKEAASNAEILADAVGRAGAATAFENLQRAEAQHEETLRAITEETASAIVQQAELTGVYESQAAAQGELERAIRGRLDANERLSEGIEIVNRALVGRIALETSLEDVMLGVTEGGQSLIETYNESVWALNDARAAVDEGAEAHRRLIEATDEDTDSQRGFREEIEKQLPVFDEWLGKRETAIEVATREHEIAVAQSQLMAEFSQMALENSKTQLELELAAGEALREKALAQEGVTMGTFRQITAGHQLAAQLRETGAAFQEAGTATAQMATQQVAAFAATSATYKREKDNQKQLIADILQSAGLAAVARGGILLFTPGSQAAGAGLIAAGVAAQAVAGRIAPRDKGGGASTAGPVAAGVSAPTGGGTTVQGGTNVSFVNNFNGLVVDRRATAREVATVVEDAQRMGYL